MGQTLSCLYLHIMIATHDRKPLLTGAIMARLNKYIGDILRAEKCVLVDAGGTADHVHLLVSVRPNIAPGDVIRAFRGKTEKWVRETFPEAAAFEWQSGYSVFSVSHSNIEKVKEFIAKQDEHHRKASFRDELVAILKKHGVEFDGRYVK